MGGRQADGADIPHWLRIFRQQVASPERINRIWELPRLPPPYDEWREFRHRRAGVRQLLLLVPQRFGQRIGQGRDGRIVQRSGEAAPVVGLQP